MAYFGFYAYDGVEIVNLARTESYADALGLSWWSCKDSCPDLVEALEVRRKISGLYGPTWKEPGVPYLAPSDSAPWYDPNYEYSGDFAGVVILDAFNQHSSTHVGTVQERATDGAVLLPTRRTSREMYFRVLLLAKSELGAHYGLTWLTSVLTGGDVCRGESKFTNTYSDISLNLDYYKRDSLIEPIPDNVYQLPLVYGYDHTYAGFREALAALAPTEGVEDFPDLRMGLGRRLDFLPVCPDLDREESPWRHMVDVGCVSGPAVITEHNLGGDGCDGGHWMEVEFTMTAGSPGIWHDSLPLDELIDTFNYNDIRNEWLRYKDADDSVDEDLYTGPLFTNRSQTYSGVIATMFDRNAVPEPPPAALGGDGPSVQQVIDGKYLDPECPAVPLFPSLPADDLLCQPLEADGDRRVYQFSAERIPKFLPLGLQMKFTAFETMRNIRVSLVPETGSFSGGESLEFWITYLSERSSLIIDSKKRQVVVLPAVADPTLLTPLPGGHLVVVDEMGTSYEYPSVVCPTDFSVVVQVPDEYNITALSTTIQVVARDM